VLLLCSAVSTSLPSLSRGSWGGRNAPVRIADDQERDVDFVCVGEDVVAGGLDHFAVRDGY
jgi:hypothetical protein